MGYILHGSKFPEEKKDNPKVKVVRGIGPMGSNDFFKHFQEVSDEHFTAKFTFTGLGGVGYAVGIDARTGFLYFDPNLGVFKFTDFKKFSEWWIHCWSRCAGPNSAFALLKKMNLFIARYFVVEKEMTTESVAAKV